MIEKLWRHVRRNHALEHATINLLSQRYPRSYAVGFSRPHGFTLYTALTAEEVIPAARDALAALKGGAAQLAVHENCGTNLVVSAALTTLATVAGMGYRQRRSFWGLVERLPQTVLLNAFALVVAMPLARWIQAHWTTDPNVSDLEIASFFTDYQGGSRRIRVHTRQVAP